MLSRELLTRTFQAGLDYPAYVATGTPGQQAAWRRMETQVALTPAQKALIEGFAREMPVLVVSGIWCGDCAQQCPLLACIAAASRRIRLRFVDRDEQREFASHLRINAGDRVPVAVFMAEDHELVAIYGDKTLSRYRALAARELGPACPLPGAPTEDEEARAALQDWLDEFERVQLLLRLSGRLRARHGD